MYGTSDIGCCLIIFTLLILISKLQLYQKIWFVVNPMSFKRNLTPFCHDKKIVLRTKTFLDHASHSWSVPNVDNLATPHLGNFHHMSLSLDVVNLSSNPCKTPTLSSRTTFLNFVLMLTIIWCCLCLSKDLLSSFFWLMNIKTLWPCWKDYHCLKYTHLEHVVSL